MRHTRQTAFRVHLVVVAVAAAAVDIMSAAHRDELSRMLMRVEQMHREALEELARRTSNLQHLDDILDKAKQQQQQQQQQQHTPTKARRVMLAPHPSPIAETPMRTSGKMPVQSMRMRSKWTDPTDPQCGPSARPSFTAAELQSARAEAYAERMAAAYNMS